MHFKHRLQNILINKKLLTKLYLLILVMFTVFTSFFITPLSDVFLRKTLAH